MSLNENHLGRPTVHSGDDFQSWIGFAGLNFGLCGPDKSEDENLILVVVCLCRACVCLRGEKNLDCTATS